MTESNNTSKQREDVGDFTVPTVPFIRVEGIADVSQASISRDVLLKIIDLAPIAVYLKDKEGHYVYLNQKARHTLSKDGKEPLGMLDRDATPVPLQYESFRSKELDCMEKLSWEVTEEHWTDPVDHKHHVNGVLNIPIAANGQGIGILAITQEITHAAEVRFANNIVSIIRHDWVNSLLIGLQHLLKGPGELDRKELGRVFEFMHGYLENLGSVLNDYETENRQKTHIDLARDILQYMQEISAVVRLRVRLMLEISEPACPVIMADAVALRILCYEMMRNHQKYGNGQTLLATLRLQEPGVILMSFFSSGNSHSEPNAYTEMFQKGKRFEVLDRDGLPKDPPGLGRGLHFCKSVALAHNRLVEKLPGDYCGQVYGAYYDSARRANAFWFMLPTRGPATP